MFLFNLSARLFIAFKGRKPVCKFTKWLLNKWIVELKNVTEGEHLLPKYVLNASVKFWSTPTMCQGSMAGAVTNISPCDLSKQPCWAGLTRSISHI